MNRDSDEECLALIATIRAASDDGRCLGYGERERLLDNLEARIADLARLRSRDSRELRELADICAERDGYRTENARLREQLADLGTEFVKLTGEVERLNAVCVIKDEEITSLRSELREAKADHLEPEERKELAKAQHQWAEDRSLRFRDVIREEVAKATAESSREIAVQLIALSERLAAVELHEAANQPGEPSFRLRKVIREEVAREVAVQLVVAFARLYAFVATPPKAQEAQDS